MTANPRTVTKPLTGRAKLDDVSGLLSLLRDDLRSSNLSSEQRRAALERLKVYGRDPKNAEAIFAKDGIEVLVKHGLEKASSSTSLEALRCLANAMLLEPKTRQIFVDLGYVGQLAERLKIQDSDNEFLVSRILFLTTYETRLDFDLLFEKHSLGKSINSHIARHAQQLPSGSKDGKFDSVDQAAISESLKLLFNLSTFYPHRIKTFALSIENIFDILNQITILEPPLQSPINYLINALVNLDLQDGHLSTSQPSPHVNIDKLITLLNKVISTYKPLELETHGISLLTVLRKIYDSAPKPFKNHMKSHLLPKESERDLPLGKSNTLPSRLLRLSTSPVAPNLREAISSLLFDLSDHDPTTFVRNVGYGFAAGYLMSHDLPVPETAMAMQRHRSGHVVEEGEEEGEPINPVTGQRLSKDPLDSGPEMSEEEKEREAERLFVLFQRLRATGVMDVGTLNPVREAVESGRFDRESGGGNGKGVRNETGKVVEEVDEDHA
jgi:Guanine nucleotide exchange factor synembryn